MVVAAISDGIEQRLRAVSPREQLARLEKLRAVLAAAEAGWEQREIARLLGVTQPEVSSLIKAAGLRSDVRERSPREVLWRHAVGEIGHEAMMDEPIGWDYTFGGPPADESSSDAYVRASWDQIERARGLLGPDDYQWLLEVTATRRTSSRAKGSRSRGSRRGLCRPRAQVDRLIHGSCPHLNSESRL